MKNDSKILNLAAGCQARTIPPMPDLRTDDRVRIYDEEHGRGTPLALAHGIGGNADLRDVNVKALAQPRGHARSDRPEDPALDSFQRWGYFANRDQPEAWNRAALELLARRDERGARARTARR